MPDQEIEAMLNRCLIELAHHSGACFEFAYKSYERLGRGCLFWLFTSFEKMRDFAAPGDNYPALAYYPRKLAVAFQYEPVLQFIRQYDPRSHFVALVAVRTGDRRDSMMKVTHLAKSAHRHAVLPVGAALPRVHLKNSKNSFWLTNSTHICANALCTKTEGTPGVFKRCSGCLHRFYCSRACQVLHWKAIHKQSCASEREWAVLQRHKDAGTELKKQQLMAETEIANLKAEKELLERAAAAARQARATDARPTGAGDSESNQGSKEEDDDHDSMGGSFVDVAKEAKSSGKALGNEWVVV